MTVEQFNGFRASGPGSLSGRIEEVGSAPCGVEKFQVTVTLKLEGVRPGAVVACDEHAHATERPVRTSGGAGSFSIRLDPASPYHVVRL